MVFCAAETAFLRAEGKLRGWNVGSKTAKAYYEDGINLSMEQYQVSATEYMTRLLSYHMKVMLCKMLLLQLPIL